jgi:nitrite reductase/ring-hydroxylating ferredoxin subunit
MEFETKPDLTQLTSPSSPFAQSAATLSDEGFQRVAEISELEPHGQFSKWVGDHDLLIYRYEGDLKVLSNVCPHFGGPVGYHKAKDGKFVCLWHNYEFSTKDGSCITNKHLGLRDYEVREFDGGIWVKLVERVSGN